MLTLRGGQPTSSGLKIYAYRQSLFKNIGAKLVLLILYLGLSVCDSGTGWTFLKYNQKGCVGTDTLSQIHTHTPEQRPRAVAATTQVAHMRMGLWLPELQQPVHFPRAHRDWQQLLMAGWRWLSAGSSSYSALVSLPRYPLTSIPKEEKYFMNSNKIIQLGNVL